MNLAHDVRQFWLREVEGFFLRHCPVDNPGCQCRHHRAWKDVQLHVDELTPASVWFYRRVEERLRFLQFQGSVNNVVPIHLVKGIYPWIPLLFHVEADVMANKVIPCYSPVYRKHERLLRKAYSKLDLWPEKVEKVIVNSQRPRWKRVVRRLILR